MAILEVKELGKTLGSNRILDRLSLGVEPGEIIALLGPSGSGKTTLLRCLAGLETPDEGRITLDSRDLFNAEKLLALPPERRNIGLVFQSYALWPHRTVFENVAFGPQLRKIPKTQVRGRVLETLKRLDLLGLENRYPGELSGGQQQRVSLARAFVMDPVLLLLDEPLSNLDAKLREYARVWLREALKESGKTAIFVTHDQAEAMAIADRIAILSQGSLVQIGTPQEVYEQPQTLFVADFMGNPNILEGVLLERDNQGRVVVDLGEVRVEGLEVGSPRGQPGQPCKLVLRPEHLRLGQEGGLEARPEHSIYLGAYWEHWVRLGRHRLRLTSTEPLGARVGLTVDPTRALVFYA